MRIAHVTNYWPNRFGLAHYADDLIHGIGNHRSGKQFVIGEGNSAASDTDLVRCLPAWHRAEDYVAGIVSALRAVRADVAVFQYANDLFGDDERFPRLLREVEAAGVRAVATLHSVYPPERRCGHGRARDFDLALAAHASCLHVHSARMKADLVARGVPIDKVAVIPHGSRALEARDPAESRARLGVPADARVILFFGYIWSGKGLHVLLPAFARLRRRVPEAFLYIGGYTRHQVLDSMMYMAYLRARIRLLGIRRRTRLWGGYVPDDEVPWVYSAADVVALPYRQDYSSVSGVVHQTAGIGKLMLCSRIAKFDEVGEAVSPQLLVDPDDLDGWARGLERLLTDRPFAEAMRRRILDFAAATSWDKVAAQHLALYERLLRTGSAAAGDAAAGTG
jgi:glycosyltransferase involved in cell wall biosynthesis